MCFTAPMADSSKSNALHTLAVHGGQPRRHAEGALAAPIVQTATYTFDDTQARYLVAIAQDDDADAPDHKAILREAAAEAGRPAKVEVYAGDHGWTVPDSPAYDRPEAERAYADLLALYGKAL